MKLAVASGLLWALLIPLCRTVELEPDEPAFEMEEHIIVVDTNAVLQIKADDLTQYKVLLENQWVGTSFVAVAINHDAHEFMVSAYSTDAEKCRVIRQRFDFAWEELITEDAYEIPELNGVCAEGLYYEGSTGFLYGSDTNRNSLFRLRPDGDLETLYTNNDRLTRIRDVVVTKAYVYWTQWVVNGSDFYGRSASGNLYRAAFDESRSLGEEITMVITRNGLLYPNGIFVMRGIYGDEIYLVDGGLNQAWSLLPHSDLEGLYTSTSIMTPLNFTGAFSVALWPARNSLVWTEWSNRTLQICELEPTGAEGNERYECSSIGGFNTPMDFAFVKVPVIPDGWVEDEDPNHEYRQFTCDSSTDEIPETVEARLVCDGIEDCPGGEDESSDNCFTCDDGTMIPAIAVCNGKTDCRAGEDECECEGSIQCTVNGSFACIPRPQLCDWLEQCDEGEDERDCMRTECLAECVNGYCDGGTCQCRDGYSGERCERREWCHCVYGSCDENNVCHCDGGFQGERCEIDIQFIPSCEQGGFYCRHDQQCIPYNNRCDQKQDCNDGTDETGCPPHLANTICATDDPLECLEGTCLDDEFMCDSGVCIGRDARCDGEIDCEDKSDELGCRDPTGTFHCEWYEFTCNDGECVRFSTRCGHHGAVGGCMDGSEQHDCPACAWDQFTCDNQQCIPAEYKYPTCDDGSDEFNCQPGTTLTFVGGDGGGSGCGNGYPDPENPEICVCFDGYDGPNCQFDQSPRTTYPWEVEDECPNGYLDHDLGQCICFGGYYGQFCEYREEDEEPTTPPWNGGSGGGSDGGSGGGSDCYNGYFNPETNVCDCHEGYYGPSCENYNGPTTWGSGSGYDPGCVNGRRNPDNDGVCVCDWGYSGDSCDYWQGGPTTTGYDPECVHGRRNYTNNGVCVCYWGYSGDSCDYWQGGPTTVPSGSGWDAECQNGHREPDTNQCVCNGGYYGENCQYWNGPTTTGYDPECVHGWRNYTNNGVCVCYWGYSGEFCDSWESTTPFIDSECDAYSDCGYGFCDTTFTSTCICDDGYYGDRCQFGGDAGPDDCNGFQCWYDGTCIDYVHHCNDVVDCDDGSDEYNCEEDPQFECLDGSTIPNGWVCDGEDDCDSGNDELGCPTGGPESCYGYYCWDDGRCLDYAAECNGIEDCQDGSDEMNCEGGECYEGYRCGDGQCVDYGSICDGHAQCMDGSDEYNCDAHSGPCEDDEFHCPNGWCLARTEVCDYMDDCGDYLDEKFCPYMHMMGAPECGFGCGMGTCEDAANPHCQCYEGFTGESCSHEETDTSQWHNMILDINHDVAQNPMCQHLVNFPKEQQKQIVSGSTMLGSPFNVLTTGYNLENGYHWAHLYGWACTEWEEHSRVQLTIEISHDGGKESVIVIGVDKTTVVKYYERHQGHWKEMPSPYCLIMGSLHMFNPEVCEGQLGGNFELIRVFGGMINSTAESGEYTFSAGFETLGEGERELDPERDTEELGYAELMPTLAMTEDFPFGVAMPTIFNAGETCPHVRDVVDLYSEEYESHWLGEEEEVKQLYDVRENASILLINKTACIEGVEDWSPDAVSNWFQDKENFVTVVFGVSHDFSQVGWQLEMAVNHKSAHVEEKEVVNGQVVDIPALEMCVQSLIVYPSAEPGCPMKASAVVAIAGTRNLDIPYGDVSRLVLAGHLGRRDDSPMSLTNEMADSIVLADKSFTHVKFNVTGQHPHCSAATSNMGDGSQMAGGMHSMLASNDVQVHGFERMGEIGAGRTHFEVTTLYSWQSASYYTIIQGVSCSSESSPNEPLFSQAIAISKDDFTITATIQADFAYQSAWLQIYPALTANSTVCVQAFDMFHGLGELCDGGYGSMFTIKLGHSQSRPMQGMQPNRKYALYGALDPQEGRREIPSGETEVGGMEIDTYAVSMRFQGGVTIPFKVQSEAHFCRDINRSIMGRREPVLEYKVPGLDNVKVSVISNETTDEKVMNVEADVCPEWDDILGDERLDGRDWFAHSGNKLAIRVDFSRSHDMRPKQTLLLSANRDYVTADSLFFDAEGELGGASEQPICMKQFLVYHSDLCGGGPAVHIKAVMDVSPYSAFPVYPGFPVYIGRGYEAGSTYAWLDPADAGSGYYEQGVFEMSEYGGGQDGGNPPQSAASLVRTNGLIVALFVILGAFFAQ